MKRFFSRGILTLMGRDLVVMSLATFFMRFGQGLLGGARANFFINTLGITGGQVLWLEGIREIPGLALVFIAALTMKLPPKRQAAAWAAIIGVGYMLYATVNSYVALLAVATFTSFGFHGFMPLSPVLGMSLATEDTRGRVLGMLASVGSLATIVGMGVLALTARAIESISLRWSYVIGGAIILIAAFLLTKLPDHLGSATGEQPRILLKGRYWLYYVLTFFEGSRKQVMGTFTSLVLVDMYGWKVWQISSLLVISSLLNLVLAPYLGSLVDRYGTRPTLSASYVVLVLCCVGYATIPVPVILAGLYVVIRLTIVMSMGLNIYVSQIAPPEELTPTLSAGVSINHVTSVAMPLIAGMLMPIIKYNGLFIMTGTLIAVSVPFALAMRAQRPLVPQVAPLMAE